MKFVMLNLDCWRTTNRVFPKVKDLIVMNGLVQGKKIAYNLRSQLKALVLPMTKAKLYAMR